MKIQIENYNPDWSIIFQKIKDELDVILGELKPIIEHIGSTSVPDLAAKPIIDILIGLENSDDLEKSIKPMISSHYIYYEVYNSSMPQRRFFVKLKDKKDTGRFKEVYSKYDVIPYAEIHERKLAHVHIWKYGTPAWIRHIAFRDYLVNRPEVRMRYEAVKRQLSLIDWKDGNDYNDGKNSFIKSVELDAISWYDQQRNLH